MKSSYRGIFAALVVVVALLVAPSAQAAMTVFGGEVPCHEEASFGHILACSGQTHTFDGTRIDVNVFLPPTGGTGGPYPTIGDFHGWGGAKQGLTTEVGLTGLPSPAPPAYYKQQPDPRIQGWAEHGYAVFSMSDRGWGYSCSQYDPQVGTPECSNGYNHLMDDRYEVRDAQYLIAELAEEGVAEPKKIGATGASYGGGMSMALAALRNRVMKPNGELMRWETEGGEEMEIAAAVPQWPWTDLAYALAPNGRNLDYVTDSTYRGPSGNFPVGVAKASFTEYLYQSGLFLSNYNGSSIPGWRERLLGGEPYTDPSARTMIEQLTTYHSSFYINHEEAPSPLLIQNGWNDDLFPVDEALRFYQRTRSQYLGDPISLFFMDDGHQRSQNKAADVAAFNQRLEAWFAHYLKGEGANPSSSVEALTTTCPKTAPSEGPYAAADWSGLSPGEIRLQSATAQTIEPGSGGKTPSSEAFEPIEGPGACATVSGADQPGVANYRLAPVPAGGFTLMGSPTIIAKVESPSPNAELAARLVDVSPEGTESLIARGLYRPTGGSQEIVFQLHPQGYYFAAGHVAKLELLPSDFPYALSSRYQVPITVSNLELRLPVMEQPGSLGGLVQKPAPKVVPPGYQLAAEFQTQNEKNEPGTSGGGTTTAKPAAPVVKIGTGNLAGKLTASRKVLFVPLSCGGEGDCSGRVSFLAKLKGKKGRRTVATGSYSSTTGKTATARVPLNKAGRKLVKELLAGPHPSKTLSGLFALSDSSRPTSLKSQRAVQLPRAH
jgi:predicted acyl esterase